MKQPGQANKEKKDNSAFIGIAIGVILFALMTPTLVQMSQNESIYELPSFNTECDHSHENESGYSSHSSFGAGKRKLKKERSQHDDYLDLRMSGNPAYKYHPDHAVYKDLYKEVLP